MKKKRKDKKPINLLEHFKKLIFRDLKPLLYLMESETKNLGTFTSFWPYMFNFTFSSISNKIDLLYRLEDPEHVRNEIVLKIEETIDSMANLIDKSSAPYGLKARALAAVATANLMLDRYDLGLNQFKLTNKYIESIDSPLHRSSTIREMLYFVGSVGRFSRRTADEIPSETMSDLASIIAPILEKNVVEADIIDDPYVRAKIYTNLGFGSRMFSVTIKREIIAEWFDIDQAQRLALDALNEVRKIGDWFKRSIIFADAATVLAISGEDTVSLASEKFDEATETAFKRVNDTPIKSAYVLGRIAYDKAFTRFYMDSDKYFYESIAILLETGNLDESLGMISKILRLASKVRYFYVVYEVIRDWLLPLIDSENDAFLKAKHLSLCSHLTLPVSISWSINIARESLSLIKRIIDYEILPSYEDYGFIDRPLKHISTIIGVMPLMLHSAYVLPQDINNISGNITSMVERFLNLYLRLQYKYLKKGITEDLLIFTRKLGHILGTMHSLPVIVEKLQRALETFFGRLNRFLKSYYGENSIFVYLPILNYIYGLSAYKPEDAQPILKNIISSMFTYNKNVWMPKDEQLIKDLPENRHTLEAFSDALSILIESSYRVNNNLNNQVLDLLIDLSEVFDQKTYTKLFVAILSKIKDKSVAGNILINVLNVLIDEEKISKKVLPRSFFRIIRSIDPAYAKMILDELS